MRKSAKVEEFQSDEAKSPDKRWRDDSWRVYDDYEIRGHKGARFIYAPATLNREGRSQKNEPRKSGRGKDYGRGRDWYTLPYGLGRGGLFTDFASLVEDADLDVPPRSQMLDTDKNAQVALMWARQWGVLGLTKKQDGNYDDRGGKEDTVAAFAFEAWAANSVLRLYDEANKDGGPNPSTVATLLEEAGTQRALAHLYTHVFDRAERKAVESQKNARDVAMYICEETTMSRVRDYCYPALRRRVGNYNYTQGFGCANLLGAIWMGMFWILWDNRTYRCALPECNKIIRYRPTPPRRAKKNDRSGGYATRSDKVYCDEVCQRRHYYLTRTKPRRQAARKV